MYEFKLPEIGEGVTEGEIVKWLVKEGDPVAEDQPIVEVMTDKATVEIASPKSGRIDKLLAKDGETVAIGRGLVLIQENGAGGPAKAATAPAPARPVEAAAPTPPPPQPPPSSKPLASPATRKLARELGINLATVRGSGPSGRVMREDLTAVRVPADSAAPSGTEERVPLRGIRKKIAEHLVHSKHTAPHFSIVEEVDFTEITNLREHAKSDAEERGIKITYLAFLIPAVTRTLKEFPMLNASLDDERGEIVLKRYYNLGIAAATKDGLVVPVLKDADRKSVWELARDIAALAQKARDGKLSLEELKGGTFTITSTGNSGGILATPILNHPEVAILGLNRIKDTPVVRKGEIVIRKIGYLSLSLDHRVVDGAVAAAFLQKLREYVENPGLLLLGD